VEAPGAAQAAQELGYRTVLWSVDAQGGKNPPPELIAALVEQNLSPGAIVRLTTAGTTTAEAIPLVAGILAKRGYRAVTVSELLLPDNYYVDRESGEQRALPGSRAGERPVLAEWWERRRCGAKRGVTLEGRPMEGLLPPEVRREVEELARRVDRAPVDARWDAARNRVEPEVEGRRVAVEATVAAVLAAPPGTAVSLKTEKVAPRVVEGMFSPVYRGRTDGRRAALMFNVAWGNEVLPGLLDELDRAGVKATFFILGEWANRFPELLGEIARRGHCLGSHAYLHVDLTVRTPEEVRASLRRTEEAVKKGGGELAPLFAPPSGAVTSALARLAAREGYWTVMWTADTIDWQRPDPEVIRARVLAKLVPGTLVLMHPTEPTLKALPGLIGDLRSRGYSLVTVPELLPVPGSAPP
jgi:peptidoglycan/xylan/chitin deacetylase (PgdA/CDA1 family)